MKHTQFHDAFDDGCGVGHNMGPAVTVEPGVTFTNLYRAVNAKGYVVVGGNGPTVSTAGGYLQGGGHSPIGRALGQSHVKYIYLCNHDYSSEFCTQQALRPGA